MAQIDIVNVQKHYGSYHALRDVSISIPQGEFLVLVGPSGCGKSTLLRSIAGLEDISGGVIAINGEPINDSSPQDRNMAMVFQNYALYPHMTVRNNLAFSLKLQKFSKEEIASRVDYAAKMLGLTEYLERRPKALSGGQRQRVAMGRAMVRKPAAFLFDEPLSNLDAKLRVSMRTEIRRLQRELGATAVYVTHDQVEAMTMGDRIAVVNHGALEQVGTPLELYNDPDNKFVAGFIGSPPMNFLSARADGRTATLANGESIQLPVSAEGDVALGIRPENICLVGSQNHQEVTVRIDRHFNLGAQTQLFCELSGEEIEVTLSGNVDSIRYGLAKLKFSKDAIFVFDKNDQRVR